jgi:hypothetical protein
VEGCLTHLFPEDEIGMQHRGARRDEISIDWEDNICLGSYTINDPLRMNKGTSFRR